MKEIGLRAYRYLRKGAKSLTFLSLTASFVALFAVWKSFPDNERSSILQKTYQVFDDLFDPGAKYAVQASPNVDVAYVIDQTSSMGPFFIDLYSSLNKTSEAYELKGLNVRFAAIAFSDSPSLPEVLVSFGANNYSAIRDTGVLSGAMHYNGDRPERALDAVLYAALELDWNQDSNKMVVLITDSPSKPNLFGLSDEKMSDLLAKEKIFFSAIYLGWIRDEESIPYQPLCDGINYSMSGDCVWSQKLGYQNSIEFVNDSLSRKIVGSR